eukprot:TRINITY_DN2522_c0_g1_i1.p1 TRINITY_DN2522_c0_g1~~TRINITY_DN2522_c0_g1_i1.p1  ORF type:complete len:464 (-),score=134.91 TRINITY_DN2522_c0_g1_i1:47-1438(-)
MTLWKTAIDKLVCELTAESQAQRPPAWNTRLSLCDLLTAQGGDSDPQTKTAVAVKLVMARLETHNPAVALLSLELLDVLVKNVRWSRPLVDTKSVSDAIVALAKLKEKEDAISKPKAKVSLPEEDSDAASLVEERAMRLVQAWGPLNPNLFTLYGKIYENARRKGIKFPTPTEEDRVPIVTASAARQPTHATPANAAATQSTTADTAAATATATTINAAPASAAAAPSTQRSLSLPGEVKMRVVEADSCVSALTDVLQGMRPDQLIVPTSSDAEVIIGLVRQCEVCKKSIIDFVRTLNAASADDARAAGSLLVLVDDIDAALALYRGRVNLQPQAQPQPVKLEGERAPLMPKSQTPARAPAAAATQPPALLQFGPPVPLIVQPRARSLSQPVVQPLVPLSPVPSEQTAVPSTAAASVLLPPPPPPSASRRRTAPVAAAAATSATANGGATKTARDAVLSWLLS